MYTVDRIENNIIVCEDENGELCEIVREEYMHEIKEGDIIKKENEKWVVDVDKTMERKKYIEELTKNMWKN